MKYVFFLLMILSCPALNAQDTTKALSRPGYKKATDYRWAGRLGAGIQRSVYVELGLARHRFYYNDLGYASSACYGAFEWTPIQNIYGLKGGYEVNGRALALGIEGKCQTDLLRWDPVITPKVGIGVFGVVNVFYGFNISFLNLPFSSIGRHQFSVVLNYNRLVFHKPEPQRESH